MNRRACVVPAFFVALVALGCGGSQTSDEPSPARPAVSSHPVVAVASAPLAAPLVPLSATQLDGRAFPDGVLALTWDDGPDASSLALAQYLGEHRIAATFFVVSEWAQDLSSDPGTGRGVFETGYEHIPILGQLVQLGHRLGNHTLNHVLLTDVDAHWVDYELRANQRGIDPFLTNELRLFRVPGGAWGPVTASRVAGDPALRDLVGPVRWDVDRKDWESSLDCRSTEPARECERAGKGGRISHVKPSVIARRYLASIESAKHGIVLLHDRVGLVGSAYALDVAEALVPELEARGYVFAAPVLAFSPLARRTEESFEAGLIGIADVDGDGRADVCGRGASGVVCARAALVHDVSGERAPRVAFRDPGPWRGSAGAVALQLADVDGDGRADPCGPGTFGDVDGDGRSDRCAGDAGGVACARSTGTTFDPARRWLDTGATSAASAFHLADVNGDGRADLCALAGDALACGLSNGVTLAEPTRWAGGDDLAGAGDGALHFGDLNGDGRADLCVVRPDAVACALSTGRAFTRATVWLRGLAGVRPDTVRLADVSGDRRADLCGEGDDGVVCGLAP